MCFAADVQQDAAFRLLTNYLNVLNNSTKKRELQNSQQKNLLHEVIVLNHYCLLSLMRNETPWAPYHEHNTLYPNHSNSVEYHPFLCTYTPSS